MFMFKNSHTWKVHPRLTLFCPICSPWVIFPPKDFIYLFLERGEGIEKERETKINVWLPLRWPPVGTWPENQACALTGNRTVNPLVHSLCSIDWAIPARALGDFFFKDFIYLFLERRGRREKNIDVWDKHPSVASCNAPNCRPAPQPRHMPWPGIELVTFPYAGWHPTHWASPVRAVLPGWFL